MLLSMLLILAGLVALVAGAELLVRGASRLALLLGMTPLMVGLTVVAFGTSSPELAVSTMAAAEGQSSLAVGNVVGSNIFNVLFILGLSAAITPLIVATNLVRLDVPIMIGASLALVALGLDGNLSFLDGALLAGALLAYVAFTIRQARRDRATAEAVGEVPELPKTGNPRTQVAINIAQVVTGLGILILGSRWLVGGAVDVARALGVSELVIGLTIVAAGTSMPEVATSVLAAIRGERDIAVGNVIGSNIFNIFGVLGASALVASDGLTVSPAAMRLDIPIMIAAAVACLPIFMNGYRIARWEGFLLAGYYAAYVVYLILDASKHDAADTFGTVMLVFVMPLTVLTLGIITVRALRSPATQKPTPIGATEAASGDIS